jgi:hypothetical protein
MYMRAFVIRFVFVGILGVGVALGAAISPPVAPQAKAGAKPAAVATPLPVVTLSTVHVHADAVRPVTKSAGRANAAPVAADLTSSVTSDHRGAGFAPTLRLDMPYYSFGKILPRVGKE